MRAVVQRVSSASVLVGSDRIASISCGLLILLGVSTEDNSEDAGWLAEKIARLRVFPDSKGKMNCSVADIDGHLLVVSQFTLLASTRKGTRPSFTAAAPQERAISLYETFGENLQRTAARPVVTGRFGSAMQVELVNDGPVTLVIDSKQRE